MGYVRQNVCSLLRMATRTQACQQRSIASQIEGKNADRKMRGWQIHEYGGVDALQFNHHIKMPILKNPNEVLVRVQTTSVNPIDINMTRNFDGLHHELSLKQVLIHSRRLRCNITEYSAMERKH